VSTGPGGSGLLAGRRLVVTGVLTESSIAFAVARLAQEQGAQVVLTSMGRALGITTRIARRLPTPAPVVELDVTSEADLNALPDRVRGAGLHGVDGLLHAVAFAPAGALGGGFLTAGWPDVATALHVSTYSLVAVTRALLPMMGRGSTVVGLDFDATRAWPSYDWMGVAKAGLESACRYLAREVGPSGVRVNLVAAGPLRTSAARAIPGFAELAEGWGDRAPLGWDAGDSGPAALACVALLSGWFPATTGAVIPVDGGFGAVGA